MNVDLSSAMLDSIRQTAAVINDDPQPAAGSADVAGGFTDLLKQAVHDTDAQQHHADGLVTAVETGTSDDLVGAMLASQQASLSFSTMIQVRNKLMSAFDDIIKMQV
ncbi:flagellar hook-basal body complex protein FliE [Burkholderia sp. BCC0044]|uniref:flagellar hook-basal body complex protein FliE n=1 Tax=Burkholderia sp. BCC0044 TaxID=2676295 RepID=UPI0015889805|nr:flagellar hook-basal body complex protein FliE [Burkholderia sp. BCC0044]